MLRGRWLMAAVSGKMDRDDGARSSRSAPHDPLRTWARGKNRPQD